MDILEPGITQIKWTRQQANRACGPLVYIFWEVKDGKRTALYVGRSYYGLQRPLDTSHPCARQARAEADELEFLCCVDRPQCERLEKKMIYHLQPRYNQVGKKETKVIPAIPQLDTRGMLTPSEADYLEELKPKPITTEKRRRKLTANQIRAMIERDIASDAGYSK